MCDPNNSGTHFVSIKPNLRQNDMVHLCEPYNVSLVISIEKEYIIIYYFFLVKMVYKNHKL